MQKTIYTILALLIFVSMSVGCLAEQPNITLRDIANQNNVAIAKQSDISQKMDSYQLQSNNKLDELLRARRDQTDVLQALRSEVRSLKTHAQGNIRIDISIDRGGYGEVSSFGSINEAVQFLNSIK